ncbi:expressed unknown protein [Seminavis robusta]|uniref:Uncharacterized protein n=1 Tax=Seminavis robusta TaxID=568900 RepID=A0A9N8HQN1_9STRA|nr:expressed unknown protein [Seminavis robusta]|eukprot:Sro1211_g252830.1 n/a (955) ;mRNA; r:21593-25683
MSLYDTFVYYYSDDIDPASGEVDKNLLKFDERNIISNVNQVCLAQGSTVFVQYQEMAMALVDRTFVNGYSQVSEKKWVSEINHNVKLVAESIAVEPFRCAEELFYRGDRKDRKEEFPFGGCGGKNSDKCSVSKYKFPIRFDVETTQSKATKYETHFKRVRCDRGYEIKSRQQCIEAGQNVGGILKNGELKEGHWGHTPCGCFLKRGEGAILWNLSNKKCRNEDWNYSPVCVEHRNRDDYEIVHFKTKCDSGYEIKSATECEEAGLAVGGEILNRYVEQRDWGHTPCGCFMSKDGNINFDTGRGKCKNDNGRYQSICKRKKDRKYVSLRKRVKCDPGFEIKSKSECIKAGQAIGGRLNKGNPLIGNWGHTPCGCFVGWNSLTIHWDDGSKCANDGWNYHTVCKNNPVSEKYKRVQFTKKCPGGEEITTVSECAVAGQALGGWLGGWKVEVRDWGHTPCGCFLTRDGRVHFDTGKSGCENQGFNYEAVCHQAPESNGVGRDVHGKLLSNDKSGFVTMSYEKVRRTADSCINTQLAELHEDCLKESNKKQNSKYYECKVEKREKAIKECDRFGPVQTALDLVFGSQTSPGFICGIKDAIVNDGVPMPGSCCLDAPYELDGDLWGQPYDCESNTPCKTPGPFLAGVNKDACDAHGGTWCPSKSTCATLKDCIDSLIKEATKEERLAYEEYLRGAPTIEDPTDRHACGRTRGYFGFDENFINDQQISLALIPPDRSSSTAPAVQGHDAWQGTVFALKVLSGALEFIMQRFSDIECPCGPFCIAENVCKGVKETLIPIFTIIFQVAQQLFQVAENLFELLSGEADVIRAQENTEVLFENMQLMADYLVDMRAENRKRNHRDLAYGSDNHHAAADFKVEVQVLPDKSVVALTTVNGVQVDANFTFSKLDESKNEISVDFTTTVLEPGKTVLEFGGDVGAFLFMKASPLGGDQKKSQLVSFN